MKYAELLRVFRDWELGWFVGWFLGFCWWFLVQVGVWIDAGSRYETEKNNGAGYFLEHLAFKVSLMKFMIPLSVNRLSQRPESKKLVSWLWNFWGIIAGYASGKEQYGLSFLSVYLVSPCLRSPSRLQSVIAGSTVAGTWSHQSHYIRSQEQRAG